MPRGDAPAWFITGCSTGFGLVLGNGALDVVQGEIEALRRELDAWEKTSRATDFPQESPPR